jgi:ATP-dependent Clp protease ATP-binding subunit ClpA
VLFDEIEKASDSLWNLLLGILDKATLVLGDNHQTDFSRSLIFLTSNLGATEMKGLVRPGWGFSTAPAEDEDSGKPLAQKLSRAGVQAARKKLTPEFINRLDAMIVFNALGEAELRQITEIELRRVQERIFTSKAAPFVFRLTEAAVDQLLVEGTDPRYGARHLRRAIDRLLVKPIASLLASDQVRTGDCLLVDSEPELQEMVFRREAASLSPVAMAKLAQIPFVEEPAPGVARPEHRLVRRLRACI